MARVRTLSSWLTTYTLPVFLSAWFAVTGWVVHSHLPPFPVAHVFPWMFWVGSGLILLSITYPFSRLLGAVTGTVIATVGMVTSMAIIHGIVRDTMGSYGLVWLGSWVLVIIIGWLWPPISTGLGLKYTVQRGRLRRQG